MHCRDAKLLLAAQRDGELSPADVALLQSHLKQCPDCLAIEQRQYCLDALLHTSPSRASVPGRVQTARIMQAVEQRRQVSQQLEDIRLRQQTRVARLRPVGSVLVAIVFFTIGSIPLLFLAIILVQTDVVERALSPLSSAIDVLFVVGQYLQQGLTYVTRDTWLLAGIAFAVVIMMGMWLRLMRHPQEA